MSKPVSDSDIEDVLSSIRRLVSEEPVARKSAEAQATPGYERLVLTPAFRVPESGEDTPANEPVEPVAEGAPAATPEPKPQPDDAPMAVDAVSEMPSPDALIFRHDPKPRVAEESADAAPEDATTHATEAQDATDTAPEEIAVPELDDNAPKTDAAEDPAPDAMSDARQLPEAYEASEEWREPAPEIEVAKTEPTQAKSEEPKPAQAPRRPADLSLKERIAELEAAIEQAPQEWEPDGSEDGLDDETRPLSFDVSAATQAPSPEDTDPSVESLTSEPEPDQEAAEGVEPAQDVSPTAAEAEHGVADDAGPSDDAMPVATDASSVPDDDVAKEADHTLSLRELAAQEPGVGISSSCDDPLVEDDASSDADTENSREADASLADASAAEHGQAAVPEPEAAEGADPLEAEPEADPESQRGEPADVEHAAEDEAAQTGDAPPVATEAPPEPAEASSSTDDHVLVLRELVAQEPTVAILPSRAGRPSDAASSDTDAHVHDEAESVEDDCADVADAPVAEAQLEDEDVSLPKATVSPAEAADQWASIAEESDDTAEEAAGSDSEEAVADVHASGLQPLHEDVAEDHPTETQPAPIEDTMGEEDDADLLADFAEDAAMIDEDALRDLVAALVREELSGVLGERITRNVRRLVRREIQRALAVRDLE